MSIIHRDSSAQEIWALYQRGVRRHAVMRLPGLSEEAWRFYQGDQWHGRCAPGERAPFYNFIRPTVHYCVSMVCQKNLQIVFNPQDHSAESETLCRALTRRAAQWWERCRMERLCWDVVKAACVSGDDYLLFSDSRGAVQEIAGSDVFFADESCPDLQAQPYILIRERRSVADLRRQARENGLSEEEAARIVPDEAAPDDPGRISDIPDGPGDGSSPEDARCTSLLVLWKENGVVHALRCTSSVLYRPAQAIRAPGRSGRTGALTLYPLCAMVWGRKKGSCRGMGEVTGLIPNQIQLNENLARRIANAKLTAYGKPVYRADALANPDALCEAGTAIEVSDLAASDLGSVVSYLTPMPMSDDARVLCEELLSHTRALAGASDAATGQIDPTQASGAAIIAARDQAAIPLNEHAAAYRRFIEDVALVWLDIWAAYSPSGFVLQTPAGEVTVPAETVRRASNLLRIDVTPTDAYSRYAAEQSLDAMLRDGYITFEEYVEALPDDAAAPKARLLALLQQRRKTQEALLGAQTAGAAAAAEMAQTAGIAGAAAEMAQSAGVAGAAAELAQTAGVAGAEAELSAPVRTLPAGPETGLQAGAAGGLSDPEAAALLAILAAALKGGKQK